MKKGYLFKKINITKSKLKIKSLSVILINLKIFQQAEKKSLVTQKENIRKSIKL